MIDIRTLRAAGLTETQILRVVEEDQAKRREQNRKAQQKHRSCQHDIADRADTVLPSLSTYLLPSEDKKEERLEIVALAREFVTFWQHYPHRVGKRAAATAFDRARRRAPTGTIMAGLDRYAAKTDDRPWCNPATWLNQDRWEDQPGPSQEGNKPGAQPALGEAERAAMLEEFHRVQLNKRTDNDQATQKPRSGNVTELRPNGSVVREA